MKKYTMLFFLLLTSTSFNFAIESNTKLVHTVTSSLYAAASSLRFAWHRLTKGPQINEIDRASNIEKQAYFNLNTLPNDVWFEIILKGNVKQKISCFHALLSLSKRIKKKLDPKTPNIYFHIFSSMKKEEKDKLLLRIASKKKYNININCLLKAGANINCTNEKGLTPLMLACEREHVPLVTLLLKAHADVNYADKKGMTALMIACKEGKIKIVDQLINAGSYVNAHWPACRTPLMIAARLGHIKIVLRLLKARAKINKKVSRKTALCSAVEYGRKNIMQLLLAHGANPDKASPLSEACKRGDYEIVSILLKKTHNVRGVKLLFRVFDYWEEKEESDRMKIVKRLINKGFSINEPDSDGHTPFFRACENVKNKNIIKYLVNVAGADIHHVDNENNNILGIMVTSWLRDTEVLTYLAEQGVNINHKNNNGNTPLMIACDRSWKKTVKCLIKNGAKVNEKNNDGKTALWFAEEKQKIGIVKELIKAGAQTKNEGCIIL